MAKIKDVDLDLPAEFSPYQLVGIKSSPVKNAKTYTMNSVDLKVFIAELYGKGMLGLISDTLQSLAKRDDGTPLLTAFPPITEVKRAFDKLESVPVELIGMLEHWESLGCNEIDICFVDNKFNDILSQYSTTELYKMWQNSEIGTIKSIFLEKTIKIRNYENNEVTK